MWQRLFNQKILGNKILKPLGDKFQKRVKNLKERMI